VTPGSIFSQEAYALGKMLDHSSWWRDPPKLPRGITPSDTDYPPIPLCFDNNGWVLWCELSSSFSAWHQVQTGQKWLYESILRNSQHFGVLCQHNVRPEMQRPINTRYDIQSFQVMLWDFGYVRSNVITGNGMWQKFVLSFYQPGQPEYIRRRIIGASVGDYQVKPGAAQPQSAKIISIVPQGELFRK